MTTKKFSKHDSDNPDGTTYPLLDPYKPVDNPGIDPEDLTPEEYADDMRMTADLHKKIKQSHERQGID